MALQLFSIKDQKEIYLEDESRNIGHLAIPNTIFEQMKKSPLILLTDSLENRIRRCVKEYGHYSKDLLKNSIKKIEKKLGNLAVHQACNFLDENNYVECCKLLLYYYDKKYAFPLMKGEKKNIKTLTVDDKSSIQLCDEVKRAFKSEKVR